MLRHWSNHMRLYKTLWVLVASTACLAQPAVADCSHISADQGKVVTGTTAASQPAPGANSVKGMSIQVNVDYGAQLMLVDAQGHRTGYDPADGHTLQNIPNAVYTDDSISDAIDDSDDTTEAEVRLLRVQATAGDAYWLHVLPTDRKTYRIDFLFQGAGTGKDSVHIPATEISIAPGEEHLFFLSGDSMCSDRFVTGGFPKRSGQSAPLLTYAFPVSNNIHLSNTRALRMVIVYDPEISPSSFIATLNGRVITQLFHPIPGRIEAVSLPANVGRNVVQLSAISSRDASKHSGDTFTVDIN